MGKKLKVAVVGIGSEQKASTVRGRVYIDLFQNDQRSEVTALCTKDEKVLQKLRREYKNVNLFSHYEEILKEDLDIIVICTPPVFHAEMAIQALEAGKHVLSEVPAFFTISEGVKLVETVEKTGKKYMLAENMCFMPRIVP